MRFRKYNSPSIVRIWQKHFSSFDPSLENQVVFVSSTRNVYSLPSPLKTIVLPLKSAESSGAYGPSKGLGVYLLGSFFVRFIAEMTSSFVRSRFHLRNHLFTCSMAASYIKNSLLIVLMSGRLVNQTDDVSFFLTAI